MAHEKIPLSWSAFQRRRGRLSLLPLTSESSLHWAPEWSNLPAHVGERSAMPFQCARGVYTRNEEPTLDELLAEPIVRLVMARDGVQEIEVRRLARAAMRHRLVCDFD